MRERVNDEGVIKEENKNLRSPSGVGSASVYGNTLAGYQVLDI
jgi:hypothetical protein